MDADMPPEGLRTPDARPGPAPKNTMSRSARAHDLDPDLLPWEKQPTESKEAHDAFLRFRDSAERLVGENGYWSSVWHWGYRAHEWDKHLAKIDAEEQVRYRRDMNNRQRVAARAAQQKVNAWLVNVDIAKMKVPDILRMWQLAVDIERRAAAADPLATSVFSSSNETPEQAARTAFEELVDDLDLGDEDLRRALSLAVQDRIGDSG